MRRGRGGQWSPIENGTRNDHWDVVLRRGELMDGEFELGDEPTRADGDGRSMQAATTIYAATFNSDRLGRFEIVRQIGQGGMGNVYLAYDSQLQHDVALKVPHAASVLDGQSRERFFREARAARLLRHPGIVGVYDAGEVDGYCFIAAEYCAGSTLSRWLREHSGRVACGVAAGIVMELAEAVAHSHSRGITHRDLKPGNVMLDGVPDSMQPRDAGFPFTPRITDFGLAQLETSDGTLTRSGVPLGTAAYMSPEQAAGVRSQIGNATDIHALGVILYELLTGDNPFRRETLPLTLAAVQQADARPPNHLRRDVSGDLSAICMKCLEKSPQNRYQSSDDLAKDLRRYLDGEPTTARPIGRLRRTARWIRRSPSLAGLIAVCVLSLLAGIAGLIWHSHLLGQETAMLGVVTAKLEDSLSRVNEERYKAEATRRALLQASYRSDISLAFRQRENQEWSMVRTILERYDVDAETRQIRDLAWHLLNHSLQYTSRVVARDSEPIHECVLFPDGERIAVGGSQGLVRVLDLETGQTLQTIAPEVGPIYGLAVSPDGTRLAVGGETPDYTDHHRVWEYSVASGERLQELACHDRTVDAIEYSADGQVVITAERYKQVVARSFGDESTQPFEATRRNESILLSSDNALLVAPLDDHTVRIWNRATATSFRDIGLANKPEHMALDERSDWLAISTSADGHITLVRFRGDAKVRYHLQIRDRVESLAFSASGEMLAAGLRSGDVELWDISAEALGKSRESGNRVTAIRYWTPHLGAVSTCHWLDEERLLTTGSDGLVSLHHVMAYEPLRLSFGELHARTGTLVGRGQFALVGLENGTLTMVDTATATPVEELYIGDTAITSICREHAGQQAYVGTEDGSIHVVDIGTNPPRLRLSHDEPFSNLGGKVLAIAESPTGMYIAATGECEACCVFDRLTGEKIHAFPLTSLGHCLAFRHDRAQLVHGGYGNHVALFDLETGCVSEQEEGGDGTNGLICPDDGDPAMVSAHQDGLIRIRSFSCEESDRCLRGQPVPLTTIAVSSDQRTLLSGNEWGGIQMWDRESGDHLGELRPTSGTGSDRVFVRWIACSGDNQTVVAILDVEKSGSQLVIWTDTNTLAR
ncbi:MAG: WD40 repeat domain-containing serine/threonine-protein kinase [Pirellulaceae bacterium]|nr:protein kinase [Planctomycetales bacterium]